MNLNSLTYEELLEVASRYKMALEAVNESTGHSDRGDIARKALSK